MIFVKKIVAHVGGVAVNRNKIFGDVRPPNTVCSLSGAFITFNLHHPKRWYRLSDAFLPVRRFPSIRRRS